MASVDLVFSRPSVPWGPEGVDLIFGDDVLLMLRALVLKVGRVCESVSGEEGLYPPLRISSDGALLAGGAGLSLVMVFGAIRQVAAGESAAA